MTYFNNNKSDREILWCPKKEHYQYLEICNKNCQKRGRCKAWTNYYQQQLPAIAGELRFSKKKRMKSYAN